MNRSSVDFANGRQAINRVPRYIEQATVYAFTYRHTDCFAGIYYLHSSDKSFSSIHCNTTNTIFTKVLLNLHYKYITVFAFNLKRVINLWQTPFKLNVHYRADNLFYLTNFRHMTNFIDLKLGAKLRNKRFISFKIFVFSVRVES